MQVCRWPVVAYVIDDGSTDRTPTIIREYADRHPEKIKDHSSKKNVGLVHNLHRVYAQPLNKYIALLDGDDEWTDPDKIQKQVDLLESHDHYVGCFHNVKIINREPINVPNEVKARYATYHDLHHYPDEYGPEHAIHRVIIATSSLMFRTAVVTADFFDTRQHHLSFTWQLLLRLVRSGHLKYMDMLSADYSNHKGGITKQTKKIEFNQRIIHALKTLLRDSFYSAYSNAILDAIQKEYEYLFYLVSYRELPWYRRGLITIAYYGFFAKASLAQRRPARLLHALSIKKSIKQ